MDMDSKEEMLTTVHGKIRMTVNPITTTTDDFRESLTYDDRLGSVLAYADKPTVSFEYFPPKTESGMTKLEDKFASMKDMKPVWIDVTFKSGGARAMDTLNLCLHAKSIGLIPLVHLTCIGMTSGDVDTILKFMYDNGLRNIMALRGDRPTEEELANLSCADFTHAVDLVRYIRLKYHEYFFISVAGYPECHPESPNPLADLQFLKGKIDAGADLIITQMFYDEDCFSSFVEKARTMGIHCPIVPGIMPITTYNGFLKMIAFCDTKVPERILTELSSIQDDPEAVRQYGVDLAVGMSTRLILSKVTESIHLYTMNNEETIRDIVKKLNKVLAPIHSQWIPEHY